MIKINENKKKEIINKNRIAEIKSALLQIDMRRIRPLAEGDTEFLQDLNIEAETLRQELKDLEND